VKTKLARAGLAAVCALGATIAGVTPASAATAGAAYDCAASGNPIGVTFTRTAPTMPPTKNLRIIVAFTFSPAVPIPPGGIVGTLIGPPSPPYPLTLTNPNVIPSGPNTSLTLTGASPVALSGPPTAVMAPAVSLGCGLIGTTSGTWPI